MAGSKAFWGYRLLMAAGVMAGSAACVDDAAPLLSDTDTTTTTVVNEIPGTSPASTEPTEHLGVDNITVTIEFPEAPGTLTAPVDGQVLDATGAQVAIFAFESGWATPAQWGNGEAATRTGASTAIQVQLMTAGRYSFEISEFAVSNNPCGTCEQGYSGGRVTVDVADGSVVRLPLGESTWVS